MTTAAIILAGGRASRLGMPKGHVRLGGRTLVERALDAVGHLPSVVVGPADVGDAMAAHPAACLTREDPPFAGPAAALAAGVDDLDGRGIDATWVLVLACDLVHAPEAAALLLDAPRARDGSILLDADGAPQWLCGLYRGRPLRARIADLRAADGLASASARALLGDLDLVRIPDPADLARDIDTPADLSRALALAASAPLALP